MKRKSDMKKLRIWEETFTDISKVNIGDIVAFPFSGNYILTSKLRPKFIVTKKTNIGVQLHRISFLHLCKYVLLNIVNIVGIHLLFALKCLGIGAFRYKSGYALKSFSFSPLVRQHRIKNRKVKKFDAYQYLAKLNLADEDDLLQFKVKMILDSDIDKKDDFLCFLDKVVNSPNSLTDKEHNQIDIAYSYFVKSKK